MYSPPTVYEHFRVLTYQDHPLGSPPLQVHNNIRNDCTLTGR